MTTDEPHALAHFWNVGWSCSLRTLQSCRNTAPSVNTLICSASEKSMSSSALLDSRQYTYRHAAATWGTELTQTIS